MKKSLIYIIFLAIDIFLSAAWIDIPENSRKSLFECDREDLNMVGIDFSLDGYEMKTVDEKGETYQQISYPNEGKLLEIGKPDLPRFSRLVTIPDAGEVSIEILSRNEELISEMNIYPLQDFQIENKPLNSGFSTNDKFYSNGEIFPGKILELGTPAIMRDHRVVRISVNPFQYDPITKELKIIKNVYFTVNCIGSKGINIKNKKQKRSRYFAETYQTNIINFETQMNRNEEYQTPSYLFIHPNNALVQTWLDSLMNWKHRKGFVVHSASTSETGSTNNAIKSYIQTAYDNWEDPPEFVCLVGDAGGSYNIPTGYMDGGEGDHFYTTLEGDDIFSDVFIGRLSFNSITEFQTIILKILYYEKHPFMENTNWYEQALLVGDGTHSGPSCISTKQTVQEMIESSFPNIVSNEIYNGNWVTEMSNGLNNGVGYFNYRGWGDMSGWDNGYINSLTNSNMLPFVVFITCNTGDFQGTYDSISEAFLKAGTPGIRTGAIGAICTATGQTHTTFNNCVDAGIFQGIFVDRIYHMGGALNRAKIALYNNYPENQFNNVLQFTYWNNLMGDPGLELWTGVPQELDVIFDEQVPLGLNYLPITVNDESGLPVQDAWITVLKGQDEIFTSGYTDENGEANLEINTVNTGEAKLTVTKHDFKPYLGEFEIIQADIFVGVENFFSDDDNSGSSSGNNDGFINPGENIELNIGLKNYGSSSANSVSATISTNSEFITITDSIEEYGTIGAGSSQFSSDDFDVTINDNAVGGYEGILEVLIEEGVNNQWTDYLTLSIEGANLYVFDHAISGEQDNILDPGETAELILTLKNIGSIAAIDISGELSCPDEVIIIENSTVDFGNVGSGSTVDNDSDRYIITADNQLIPGTQVLMELHLTNDDGYDSMTDFYLEIGEVNSNDPLGPDQFGYYCYDETDLEYIGVPVYDWLEIDPEYGGEGTVLNLFDPGDTGSKQTIPLPIDFKFYGETYDQITVCSNGWLSPGISNSSSFMNRFIPGPLGPSPMIAPFWDDLTSADGHVCYFHDAAAHTFIIEWSRVQNHYDTSEETFQVILFDFNYYPTSIENSPLLFQYKTFNNVDAGTYGTMYVNHGEYATIGIEDQTSLRGLQYSFSNQYPNAASELHDESAILFTGVLPKHEGPYMVLENIMIEDENGNGTPDYSENVDIFVELLNVGTETATEISAELSTLDEFIIINNEIIEFNDIESLQTGIGLSPFNVSVASNCPHEHAAFFEISVQAGTENWILEFELEIQAPLPVITEQFYDDNNNDIIDPGETADVFLKIKNLGGAALYNANISISADDPLITVNVSEAEIGDVQPDSSALAVFNVSADDSAPIGYVVVLNWQIDGDFDYQVQGDFEIAITQVPINIQENFIHFLPEGWLLEGGDNWRQVNGSSAGGSPPEAQFYWFPYLLGVQRLITQNINSTGSATIELEFKHSITGLDNSEAQVRLETSDNGLDWNTVQTWQEENLSPTIEVLTIDNSDVGSQNLRFAWVFEGYSADINSWFVDDVSITQGNPQAQGFITGNISLAGGDGDIQEVEIATQDLLTNPDENGDYLLTLPAGIYDISAALEQYESIQIEGIEVDLFESVVLDFTLNYMFPPDSLFATANENDVELVWGIPEENSATDFFFQQTVKNKGKEKKDLSRDREDRDLIGYKIYRNDEEIISIFNIEDTTYIDYDLNNGEYEYFVTAVYDGGESAPTNTEIVIIDVDKVEEISLPEFTHLSGNFPNPFNPRTTISYALKENSNVILEILNIRGQKVRTLLDKNIIAGFHNIIWNGKDDNNRHVSSGIYFYRLRTDDYDKVRKMIFLR